MSVAYQNLRHSIYLFSPVTLPFFVKSSHFYLKCHTRKESSIWIKSFVCKSTTNCHRYLKIISLCKKVAALLCRRFACWGVCKDKWILGYTDFRTFSFTLSYSCGYWVPFETEIWNDMQYRNTHQKYSFKLLWFYFCTIDCM